MAAAALRPTATLLFRPPQPLRLSSVQHLPFSRPRRHSSSSTSTAASPSPTLPSSPGRGGKAARHRARDSPEGLLRHQLDICSRNADLATALSLYDAALSPASPIRLSLHHYNCLLYLCSNAAASSPEAAQRGIDIFSRMEADHVEPNEATLTSVARLAAARRDPSMAFSLARRMAASGIPPRLRCLAAFPALRPSLPVPSPSTTTPQG